VRAFAIGFLYGPNWGVSAFGVNAFVAHEAGDILIEPHSEAGVSEHEELYVVLSGTAAVKIGSAREVELQPHDLLFIRDPAVRREARAGAPGTVVLVVGAPSEKAFVPTEWESKTLATYGRRETR
jgi:mannose-6-phosphate isomerase-like protein (cupin superfamily)